MNIFIAFANEDRDVRDKLLRQMNLVKDRQGWHIWSASELKGGDAWDTEIKNRLMDSDVILLLLSTDFFNSTYIIETELPEVIKKHKSGNCQIIPVIARKCHWKDTAFGDYAQLGDIQALPTGEKPIMSKTLWDHEDEPYFETVQGIKEAIIAFQAAKKKEMEVPVKPVSAKPKAVAQAPAAKKTTTSAPKKHPAAKTPAKQAQTTVKKLPTKKNPIEAFKKKPKTTLLDDIVQFFGDSGDAIQSGVSLFPLYGVTLGKTTVNELKNLGVRAQQIDSATHAPYMYYIIKDTNFWYDKGVAEHMYLVRSNKMPDKWKQLGFDWGLSYNEWINLFYTLGYKVTITKPPKIVQYQGQPSFVAEITAHYTANGIKYVIQLDFNYSNHTLASDKKTLYSLRITTE